MEVWLNSNSRSSDEDVDFYFNQEGSETSIFTKEGFLYKGHSMIGAHVHIDSDERQQYARSLAGTVEWIYLTFEDWSMIPIENIVAACDPTPTRIAAEIIEPLQAHGAGFALEIGVDALVCSEKELEAALIVKSLRSFTEEVQEERADESLSETLTLSEVKISSIESGHTGDRVCIDLTSLLEVGEGMLIGSTARSLALIHGETIESTYVPKRP
ncbi:MAG: 3-dehydroquinate synthase II, partial [Candidatus Poseidoniaceae archaeon]|nr:3-dehydroquinate synthase II [Candidatus Poseidoniaceae archaeon]